MDFEDELDDEIQVYYEKDEIDATNDTQMKDQFKDILDMKNAYSGVMQTPRINKFNIMDWIEQPKLANEKPKKEKIVKEGISEGLSIHDGTSMMSEDDEENAEQKETEEQRREKAARLEKEK